MVLQYSVPTVICTYLDYYGSHIRSHFPPLPPARAGTRIYVIVVDKAAALLNPDFLIPTRSSAVAFTQKTVVIIAAGAGRTYKSSMMEGLRGSGR